METYVLGSPTHQNFTAPLFLSVQLKAVCVQKAARWSTKRLLPRILPTSEFTFGNMSGIPSLGSCRGHLLLGDLKYLETRRAWERWVCSAWSWGCRGRRRDGAVDAETDCGGSSRHPDDQEQTPVTAGKILTRQKEKILSSEGIQSLE